MSSKHSHICHFKDIQSEDNATYPGSDEKLSIGSPFSKHFDFRKIGVHHELLPPGRRTSWPHAESDEEEFVYVIDGHPDVWIDGHLHRLTPGCGVGFPSGTGVSHTFMNNTNDEVRLLVVGEASKPGNQITYPLNPERRETMSAGLWWESAPIKKLGPHNGKLDV